MNLFFHQEATQEREAKGCDTETSGGEEEDSDKGEHTEEEPGKSWRSGCVGGYLCLLFLFLMQFLVDEGQDSTEGSPGNL